MGPFCLQVESPTGKAGSFFCSNSWEGEGLNTQLFTYASAVENVPVRMNAIKLFSPFFLSKAF